MSRVSLRFWVQLAQRRVLVLFYTTLRLAARAMRAIFIIAKRGRGEDIVRNLSNA